MSVPGSQLLLLVHRMPYPPNKGDKLRSYHLLRHLQRRHRVFLGCFVDDPEDERWIPELRAICPDLFVRPLSKRQAAWRSLRGLLRGESLTQSAYEDAPMHEWVQQTCATHRIDASVVFCSSMAAYAPPQLPWLIDFVDLDSAKWTQFGQVRLPPLAWVYRLEGRRLLQLERQLAAQAQASFFATNQELRAFETLAPECRGRAEVLRNGVDAEHYAPNPGLANPFRSDELPLVFTGSMNYWPNVDAVRWFVQDMLPELRRRWPALRLYIVGREPNRSVRALAGEAVEVTGSVPDVRPYLQHARLVLAPMRYARGIQNKILEAMAMAQTVVCTEACAQPVTGGKAGLLPTGSDAEGFIARINELLRLSEPERRALGARARQFVIDQCTWAQGFHPLDRALVQLQGARPC
ncbi:TIGR03087 family PEP-CTERM/XrtA system glycosyltransferase [Inhella sp.]|uniref:TIGR03087 family PEP-CTERM/XrtA system glycosyltransferase n=1 Tax=Inhella sp. TaxID=1921806 RepID=UPI0035B1E65B